MAASYVYFNSIKVRLEPIYALGLVAAYLFQFHKGTIRTAMQLEREEGSHKISIP